MSIVKVSPYNSLIVEPSGSTVSTLSALNKSYSYTFYYRNVVDHVSCFCSDNPIEFTHESNNTLYITFTDEMKYISDNGALSTKTQNGTQKISWTTSIPQSTAIYVRNSLAPRSIPTITTPATDLGNILTFSPFNYTVVDPYNSSIDITEYLDGAIINTYTNVQSGTVKTFNISNIWESVSYGNHILKIKMTTNKDYEPGFVEKIITFTKIKSPIQKLPSSATLIQRANWGKELISELSYQNLKLYNILTEKGVEVLPSEKKMSNLIDKVNSMVGIVVASDTYRADYTLVGTSGGEYIDLRTKRYAYLLHSDIFLDGSVRIKYMIANGHTKNDYTCKTWIYHCRDNSIIDTIQKDVNYNTTLTIIQDLEVKKGDVILVVAYGPTSSTSYGSCIGYLGCIGYDFY